MPAPEPAADALGILLAFPDLGEVAQVEGLAQLLPAGPLADLAREYGSSPFALGDALARVDAGASAETARRIRNWTGPGRPKAEVSRRELLRAILCARIENARLEENRLLALVTKAGPKAPKDLTVATFTAQRRRADLEKQLRALEKSG